ncbi:hypothetical protein MMC15_006347 [Xylographa vitiligo]|nr:hypothetical protein [Xylographa vitiligo]
MPDTPEPSEPAVSSNPTVPPTNAGRGGYNGSPNPSALSPTASVSSPNPNVLSPDQPSFGGRGGYHDSPDSSSPAPPQTIPYPPPNTHLEQPQPIHPTFGGRGGYHASPQSQSPVPTFAIGRHSPPSDGEHGGFGGRGGYHASQGPEPAPVPSHPAQTFAEYEAEHGHGVGSRKGSRQESPGPGFENRGGYQAATGAETPPAPVPLHHTPTFAEYEAEHGHASLSRKGSVQENPSSGFGNRGGYQAATGAETPPAPGSLRHTPTFAEYEAEHGHASLSRKGSVQEGPGSGFGNRGGYQATGGLDQPLGLPHRAATFAEYEQEHGHGTEVRNAALTTLEPGYGGRGSGYHATAPTAGALSPEAHFGAPHRAQTFSEYEAEHKGTGSRKASLQETPQPGFGGRGGYHADPSPAALSPEGPFGAPHRSQTFAEYEAQHHRPASGTATPEHGFGSSGRGGGYHASPIPSPSPALSPEGPFGAPHRAQTFADYEAEHAGAGVRKLSLQDAPEHGFGSGRGGGYHASSGSGTATPAEPPFAAPHRAQTFADYEAEHGRGAEERRGIVAEEREQERGGRGSFQAREEEEREEEREGRGRGRLEGRVPEVEVSDHEERGEGREGMGHPGYGGGRGGYQRPR